MLNESTIIRNIVISGDGVNEVIIAVIFLMRRVDLIIPVIWISLITIDYYKGSKIVYAAERAVSSTDTGQKAWESESFKSWKGK